MHARWCKAIRHPNLHLLRNQHTVIRKDGAYINIYGLELNKTYYKRFRKVPMKKWYLTEQLGICDRKSIQSPFLAHNPLYLMNMLIGGLIWSSQGMCMAVL